MKRELPYRGAARGAGTSYEPLDSSVSIHAEGVRLVRLRVGSDQARRLGFAVKEARERYCAANGRDPSDTDIVDALIATLYQEF